MIQGYPAMGNWWLTVSSGQQAHSCITSYAEFLVKHPITLVILFLLRPTFGALRLLAFPKTKFTFERERFQTVSEIQENTTGQLMAIGRTVWGPKVPTLKGTEVSLSHVRCFLSLVSSSINVSIFHITWLDSFWTDLVHWSYIYTSVNFYICLYP